MCYELQDIRQIKPLTITFDLLRHHDILWFMFLVNSNCLLISIQ